MHAGPQGQKGQSSEQPPISVKVGSSEDQFIHAIMGKTGSLKGGLMGAGEAETEAGDNERPQHRVEISKRNS